MSDRTNATTAAYGDDATCFASLELSTKSWLVGFRGPGKEKVGVHSSPVGDCAALAALLDRHRQKAERRLGRDLGVLLCFEAGRDGFWIARSLKALGIGVVVVDAASLPVNRRKRRAKTDRLDVGALVRALMAWARGEPDVLSEVRVPSVEEEDARRPHREREALLRERIRLSNRMKALLALVGIDGFEPCSRRRPALEGLRDPGGQPLPRRLLGELTRALERLDLVAGQIRAVETERDAVLAEEAAPGTVEAKIQLLARLKGVGPESATRLGREMLWRKFDNQRQVASYAGLAPSPFKSGKMDREQGISKTGNRLVRTTMVELAWFWLRWQPRSALSQWFRAKVGDRKGAIRQQTAVALARRLLIALWRYVETGQVPEGAVMS